MKHHVVRCPHGGMRHLLHVGLVNVIKIIVRDAGVPEAMIMIEARGLRAAGISGPGDVFALDFFADGRHLLKDAFMTSVYKNIFLH